MSRITSLFTYSPIPDNELFYFNSKLDNKETDSFRPLGIQVEEQFYRYLENDSRYEVIARGLQIQGEERTLGELDFLVRDSRDNKILHIELVYKFYLYLPWVSTEYLQRFIGPNFRDRLVYKLAHLRDHQFPILGSCEAESALRNLRISPHEIEQRLCFCAELFMPSQQEQNKLDELINMECIRGKWMFLSAFERAESADRYYHLADKGEWLIVPCSASMTNTRDEMITQIREAHHQGRSPMIWCNTGSEIVRMFIIPDHFQTRE